MTTVIAIHGVDPTHLTPTLTARLACALLLVMLHPRNGKNPRGDRNDAKAKHHHNRGQQPAQSRLRHHIAIANRGHRDDRPVHPF